MHASLIEGINQESLQGLFAVPVRICQGVRRWGPRSIVDKKRSTRVQHIRSPLRILVPWIETTCINTWLSRSMEYNWKLLNGFFLSLFVIVCSYYVGCQMVVSQEAELRAIVVFFFFWYKRKRKAGDRGKEHGKWKSRVVPLIFLVAVTIHPPFPRNSLFPQLSLYEKE